MNADGELRILVADDEPSMLDLMIRRLRKMGVTPDQASDGAQAQALIEQNDYDVIITDIYMPEVTGLELLHTAKERDPNVQVVVATAAATIDNAVDALNNGAFGYLTKPFDHLSVFDKVVTRAMEFRRLLLDNERMAEVQKRRGDMLEEEVTQRIRQLRDRQRDLLNLLTALPLGVTVVEEGGRVVMSNPQAERWLAEETQAVEQPIRGFMSSIHETDSEPSIEVVIAGRTIRLTAVDILHGTPKKQKVVIIGEMEHEEEGISQGTMVEEAIDRLNEGLMWLAGQALDAKADNVVKGLVREIVSLGRMMGLDIDDPVFPEVEPPPLLEAISAEEPGLAPLTAEDDEDEERLLAALQGGPKADSISEAEAAPPRRREAPPAREPISEPIAPAKERAEPVQARADEGKVEVGGGGAKARKPEAEPTPLMLDKPAPAPSPAKEAKPIASERVDESAAPVEKRAAPREAKPEAERPAAKQAKPEVEQPAAKQPKPELEQSAARESKPIAKEEKKAPAFKSRLLQKAKELESGGWRPSAAPPPKSGTNGKSHEEDDEPPDDSVLSRLAQVTEDTPRSRPAANVDHPEPPRPVAKPTPKAEPVIEEEAQKWAAYEESETGSARPGRSKSVWPPPLPSAVEDDEEEEASTEA
jgi:DNA-binding response OmpR family regulator